MISIKTLCKNLCFFLIFILPLPGNLLGSVPQADDIVLPMPEFSQTSGIFTEPVVLYLSHPNPDATIVYTFDGSEPCLNNLDSTTYSYKNQFPQFSGQSPYPFLEQSFVSRLYSDSLLIGDRTDDANKISMISSTWEANPSYLPSFPVRKATVVRARAFWEDQSSDIATHTFFVFEDHEPDYSLPIVAIALPENELFDYEEGIYTAGVDFDQWRLEFPTANTSHIHTPANFQRRGTETEKPAHFQYFVEGQPVMSQNIGIRVHGGGSRYISNKNLRFYARSVYDQQNSFDYPVFEDGGFDSFKRFILRFDGRLNNSTTNFIRDHLLQATVAHLRFDTQSYYPNVLFLNGEYWGLYGLMTRYDKHYFERVYGIEEDELDYLFNNADPQVGDNVHYLMMYDFVAENDMANPENYQYVKTLMDVDNFQDYFISQIYMGNHDWPGNNINFFRKRTDSYEPNAPYGHDGRWRWLMADLDHGFGATRPVTFNNLQYATAEGSSSWANYDWATLLIRNLLENEEFKTSFIVRFADLINTTFQPERILDLIDLYAERIAPEVPRHIARWKRLNSFQAWQNNVQLLRNYANQRPDIQRQHIISKFGLQGSYSLELNVSDQENGFIRVNTLDIKNETPGVSQQAYPWTGIYFNQLPLTLEAVAASGYVFSHWEGDYEGDEAVITLYPDSAMQLTAHFKPCEGNVHHELICFWVMDTNIPNNTPLSFLQANFSKHEQPAYITYESAMRGYPYYQGHPNWRKASMERRNAPTHLNYWPEGNNNLQYGQFAMRGLQVKQPFGIEDRENTILLHFSTLGYENIRVEFAVMDEGAAQEIVFDYLDGSSREWSDDGLEITSIQLTDFYQIAQLDLSQVAAANHNPDLKIRIRFEVDEPELNDGDRVTFNNIAVTGIPAEASTDSSAVTFKLDVSFNDAFDPESDVVYITGDFWGMWEEPGADPDNQIMSRVEETLIYTRTLLLEEGDYTYNYFVNEGWDGSEWDTEETRHIDVSGDTLVYDLWSYFILELMADPADGGSLRGEGYYNPGDAVTLNAKNNQGFVFTGWEDENCMLVSEEAHFNYVMPAEHVNLTASFDVVAITGTEGIEGLYVYPNPASDYCIIKADEIINSVNITDTSGLTIVNIEYINQHKLRFDTSELETGVYLISVFSEEKRDVLRLVVH